MSNQGRGGPQQRGHSGGGPRGAPSASYNKGPQPRAPNTSSKPGDGTSAVRTSIDFYGVQSRRTRAQLAKMIISSKLKSNTGVRFDGTNFYSTFPISCVDEEWMLEIQDKEYQVRLGKCDALKANEYDEEIIQIFNVVLKSAMSEVLTRIGVDYYDTKTPFDFTERFPQLHDSIKIYPGYATQISARRFGDKVSLVLNIDTICKVITKKNVLNILYEAGLVNDDGNFVDDANRKRARSLIGQIVCTPYNFQTYFLEDFDPKVTPRSKFNFRNRQTGQNESITFLSYYEKEHKIKLEFPDQALIKTRGRSGTTIYIIPELCVTTTIPADAKRSLPQVASIKPELRRDKLLRFLSALTTPNSKAQEVLSKFNLKVCPNMTQVRKEVMAPPTLMMPINGKMMAYKTDGKDWKTKARTDIKYPRISSRKMQVYIIHDKDCTEFLKGFYECLRKDLNRINCPMQWGDVVLVNGSSEPTHVDALRGQFKPPPEGEGVLIIQGLSNRDDKVNERNYNALKVFCLARGYFSQSLDLTIGAQKKKDDLRSKDTIINNISRQIANKFGHLSWVIDIGSVLPKHKDKTFLVVGIDVFHAPLEVDKNYTQKRSLAGVVGWVMKGTDVKFCSKVFVHKARTELHGRDASTGARGQAAGLSEEESREAAGRNVHLEGSSVSNGIGKFIAETVEKFKIPQKELVVIVYRDGVSESQIKETKNIEVSQVQKAVPAAQVVFCVVQKATHARFFGAMSPDGRTGDFGNVDAGTLISNDCSFIGWENFYLTPCKNSLSTARPVNYVVLQRPNDFSLEDLQKFTWPLHSLYPNWTDTIKLPAPTQCAHKLAFLCGELPEKDPEIHKDLQNSLFFL